MIFAVMGGDGRISRLCRLLAEAGHEVRCFALDRAGEIPGVYMAPSAAACAAGADCVVLPLPVSSVPGVLSAPQSASSHDLGMILDAVSPMSVLLGGRVDAEAQRLAAARGLHIEDYYAREALTVKNAALTAEGAVEILIRETPKTLWRSRVLVIGFGRVGKLTAHRLTALGARVTVSARKSGDRAWIEALGMESADTNRLSGTLGTYDVIVNTVPALVLPEELLGEVRRDALLVDLASKPGGMDFSAAAEMGLHAVWALGLPGETAPQSAAECIAETVMEILGEKYGEN